LSTPLYLCSLTRLCVALPRSTNSERILIAADRRRMDRRAGQYSAGSGYLVLLFGVRSLTLSSSSSEVTTKPSIPVAGADGMFSCFGCHRVRGTNCRAAGQS
jgi:hypothetical protein